MDPVLLVLLTVGGVVVLALLGAQMHGRRSQLLRQAAEDLGFSYRTNDPTLAASLEPLPLFRQGETRLALNVLHGAAQGLETVIFDLHYSTTVGHYVQHHKLSVIRFTDSQADWPTFCLRPRAFYHRLAGPLGRGEVSFENDPAFGKAYLLQATDEEAARALFNEDVRYFLTQHPGICAEASGPVLIYYRGGLIPAEELRPFLESAFQVLNVFQAGEEPRR